MRPVHHNEGAWTGICGLSEAALHRIARCSLAYGPLTSRELAGLVPCCVDSVYACRRHPWFEVVGSKIQLSSQGQRAVRKLPPPPKE